MELHQHIGVVSFNTEVLYLLVGGSLNDTLTPDRVSFIERWFLFRVSNIRDFKKAKWLNDAPGRKYLVFSQKATKWEERMFATTFTLFSSPFSSIAVNSPQPPVRYLT